MKQIKTLVVAASILFLFIFIMACDRRINQTPSLKNIKQINETGFGDNANKYAFSSAVYKGDLYVGTLNATYGLLGMASFVLSAPADLVTKGGEIWRYDGIEKNWTQVVKKGLKNYRNMGVRKMVIFDDCLYGVTANHTTGMEVWRTCNGYDWEVVVDGGFGDRTNTSGRGMGVFKGYLYVGLENRTKGGMLYRTKNGTDWDMVADKGITDSTNLWLSDFAEFNGYLYMGTLNYFGMQAYRTKDGVNFERLFRNGLKKISNTPV